MWRSVICCLLAGLLMWIPDWFGVINVWTLLIPAALFFSVPGCCFHWLPAARWSRSPSAGTAGAGRRSAKHWFRRAGVALCDVAANRSGQPGLLMTLMGLLIVLCWLPLATRMSHQGAACLSSRHRSIVISSMGERCCFIRSRITRICGAENKTPDSPHKARCLVYLPERAGTADASRPASHGAVATFRCHTIFL